MRIAHIAPPWLPIPPKNYGGTEIVVFNLIEEQIAQGHKVTLFAPGDARTSAKLVSFFPQSLIESGVPWHAHLKAFYHLRKSVDYLRTHRFDFDIVHTHLSSSADMYLFPLMASLDLPHVMTLHSRFPFDRIEDWSGDADTCYMEWASHVPVVAISESARAEVTHELQFVGIVHHGLPLTQFGPTGEAQEDYLVWLGRIVPDKGTHLAIEAAKRSGMRLILAGTMDSYRQDSITYFQDVVQPLIDGDQIQYIGPVDMQQKIALLSKAYGFLNPIEWEEPFGMVMIESMASGCPVISFARGAAPEIIVHGKTGFLVQNVDEMAAFVPRLAEINRDATRQHVEQNFSVRIMTKKYSKIYHAVIAHYKHSSSSVAIATQKSQALPTKRVMPVSVPRQSSTHIPKAAADGKQNL